jgi:hypothetical protein
MQSSFIQEQTKVAYNKSKADLSAHFKKDIINALAAQKIVVDEHDIKILMQDGNVEFDIKSGSSPNVNTLRSNLLISWDNMYEGSNAYYKFDLSNLTVFSNSIRRPTGVKYSTLVSVPLNELKFDIFNYVKQNFSGLF